MKERTKAGPSQPSVSIEEALELYIARIFPAGLPPGVNKAELIGALTERIALERPEWARRSARAPTPPTAPPPTMSYAALKQALAERARNDVPSDPNERYFHERDQEQRARRMARRDETREASANAHTVEKLRSRRTREQSEAEARAALARVAIETRLRETNGPTEPARPQLSTATSNEWEIPLGWDQLSEKERKMEVLRLWNRRRLEGLKNREDVLSPRWPEGGSQEGLGFAPPRSRRETQSLDGAATRVRSRAESKRKEEAPPRRDTAPRRRAADDETPSRRRDEERRPVARERSALKLDPT